MYWWRTGDDRETVFWRFSRARVRGGEGEASGSLRDRLKEIRGFPWHTYEKVSRVRGEAPRVDFNAAQAVGSQPLSPLTRGDKACSWITITPWALIATLFVLLPR